MGSFSFCVQISCIYPEAIYRFCVFIIRNAILWFEKETMRKFSSLHIFEFESLLLWNLYSPDSWLEVTKLQLKCLHICVCVHAHKVDIWKLWKGQGWGWPYRMMEILSGLCLSILVLSTCQLYLSGGKGGYGHLCL